MFRVNESDLLALPMTLQPVLPDTHQLQLPYHHWSTRKGFVPFRRCFDQALPPAFYNLLHPIAGKQNSVLVPL